MAYTPSPDFNKNIQNIQKEKERKRNLAVEQAAGNLGINLGTSTDKRIGAENQVSDYLAFINPDKKKKKDNPIKLSSANQRLASRSMPDESSTIKKTLLGV